NERHRGNDSEEDERRTIERARRRRLRSGVDGNRRGDGCRQLGLDRRADGWGLGWGGLYGIAHPAASPTILPGDRSSSPADIELFGDPGDRLRNIRLAR